MAQLAISFAGAAVGAAIGGPTGARAGFIFGSILGKILKPTKTPDSYSEGPKLGDLSITASTYGQAIPISYGTVRLAGNCIWSLPKQVRRNVETVSTGGKGGSQQSSTTATYSYYGTFAMSFAEGPADNVVRIWANKKLIYDASSTGSVVRKKGLKFRFYKGDETQLPDSIIEADKGVGNVPAHRGMCYIVFDSLPLADYANGLPDINAEITFAADLVYPFTDYDNQSPATTWINENRVYDFDRKIIFVEANDSVSGERLILKIQVPTMQTIDWAYEDTDIWENFDASKVGNASYRLEPCGIDSVSGAFFCKTSSSSFSYLLRIDPISMLATHSFGSSGSGIGTNTTTAFAYAGQGLTNIVVSGELGQRSFMVSNSLAGQIGILDASNMTYIWGAGQDLGSVSLRECIEGKKGLGITEIYWLSADSSDVMYIHKISIQYNASYDATLSITNGVDNSPEQVASFGLSDFNALSGIGYTITGIDFLNRNQGPFTYDPDTNSIIGVLDLDVSPSHRAFAISIEVETWSVNWIVPLSDAPTFNALSGSLGDLSKSNEVIFAFETTETVRIDKYTGEILDTIDQTDWFGNSPGPGVYLVSIDQDYNAIIKDSESGASNDGGIMYLDRIQGNGVALSTIVADLSERAGLESSEYSIAELTGITVRGYSISRQSTVRAGLEPLATAYFFDGVESDYQIKYLLRGRASSATIPQEDLASENNEFWVQNRIQEQDLPMRVNVSYMDYDRDYQEGTQHTKRAQNPFPVMYSKSEISVGLAIVLTGDEAKQISEKLLFNNWTERNSYSTNLSWEYLKLDPADVIDVSLDNGTTYKVRLSSVDVGSNLVISISALEEETANYTSTAVAENNFVPSVISDTSTSSYLIIHNVPLLADTHDQGRLRSVLYAQAGPIIADANWEGCSLHSSNDLISWEPVTLIVNELTYGSIQGILGAPSDVFAVDNTNTLTIWPTSGADNLESVTYTQFLTGAYNMAIVGNEIINFQTATDNGDGSYTLSVLLRGRRGTDTVADNHVAGEYFYLVNTTNTEGFTIPISNIGSPMYFRAVSNGQTLEEADIITVTPTGEDLKPYAPINPVRTEDDPSAGDITVTFDRRTRINGDAVGTVPLNEESEEYEVEVFTDSTFLTEIGQYTGITTNEWVYTAAQQSSDGFAGGTLYIRIYQISAEVGRGKYYNLEIEEPV